MMTAVDAFFSSAGWALCALGLAGCLVPRCFKRSVIIMILGDALLFTGIVFPRSFEALRFFAQEQAFGVISYRAAGIAFASLLWLMLMVPHLVKVYGRKKAAPEAAKAKGAGSAKSAAPGEASADPSLFNRVRARAEEQRSAEHLAAQAVSAVPADELADEPEPAPAVLPDAQHLPKYQADPETADREQARRALFSGLNPEDRR